MTGLNLTDEQGRRAHCPQCEGEGSIVVNRSYNRAPYNETYERCPVCRGSGKGSDVPKGWDETEPLDQYDLDQYFSPY